MALDTVQDYLNRCRALLLDQNIPYRYPDIDLVENLNMGILEARKLRPELFQATFWSTTTLPSFSATAPTAVVPIDPQYRVPFVYYICGHAQLRDEENTQDTRAAAFLNKFTSQMLTLKA
jgi:hypothetical protein